jgi:PIN domain nuclease of toxin-antitoxin system
VRLLLDTNAFLWWRDGSPQVSARAREEVRNPDNDIVVSIVSAWEIAIKRGIGKLQFLEDFEAVMSEEAFNLLPIAYSHLRALELLPLRHRDPFDRLLIAQSIAEDLPVVTNDEKFALYDVKTFW